MRRTLLLLLLLPALPLAALLGTNLAVGMAARGRVFTPADVPPRRVAIVFGASVGSRTLRERVEMGAALYRQGKASHLLLSGDNRFRTYDEPRAMRRIARRSGVPSEALVLDYAGRRTFDSCARARTIFGVEEPVLVTQSYHLPRALYLCRRLGLDGAVGVSAGEEADPVRSWLHSRELLARARAWFDVNVRRPAVIGGPALPIAGAARPAPPDPDPDPEQGSDFAASDAVSDLASDAEPGPANANTR